MSWQNKYRPQKIADLHLHKVRQQMQQYLTTGKLPAVMLFAGPKGTGKTSTARIIAAILNSSSNSAVVKQIFLDDPSSTTAKTTTKSTSKKSALEEPDLTDDQIQKIFQGRSFLVQEIDAASNSRVEDVRQLQDQIFLPPSMSQISVFIFDEVHMLSNSAFNALLKTLEEPPAHCVFILATTELHKIPPTVASRCSLVEFQKASPEELQAAFERVLTAEKVESEAAALKRLAAAADGSFRDGIKLLEMAALTGRVDSASVSQILHADLSGQLPHLLKLITQDKDEAQISQFFSDLRQQGVDEQYFLKSWLNFLYQELQLNLHPEPDNPPLTSFKIAHFLLQQTNLTISPQERQLIPFLSLELKCLELVMKAKAGGNSSASSPAQSPPTNSSSSPAAKPPAASASSAAAQPSVVKSADFTSTSTPAVLSASEPVTNSDSVTETISTSWSQIVKTIAQQSSYLAAIFQLAEVEAETATAIKIGLGSKFHCDLMKQMKNLQVFHQTLTLLDLPLKEITFTVLKTQPTPAFSQVDVNSSSPSPEIQAVISALA